MDQLIDLLRLVGALVNIVAGIFRILSTARGTKNDRAEGR